ncbi:carbohydrate esterase family 4 protein [Backusella circina FSU 941]|nr:carbohydrate esterase family 4 protein [Backusella circina FSU 941]
MILKYYAVLATLSSVALAAVDLSNFPSKTDPTQITIPNIPQTTSHDVYAECKTYQSEFTINPAEWPEIWKIATSNNINTSQEFMSVYNSIDWSKIPSAPVRTMTPEGGPNLKDYDTVNDPDCWWSATQCVKPKRPDINGDIVTCNEPETWGLTYDDGPNCSHNALYDMLLENQQTASMFYIGSNVLYWPYGALRGLKDGHHLCGHTWSHAKMTTLSNQEVLAELYYTAKAIKYVTGVTPLYWRPAQGDLDDRVRWIATQLDMTAILWTHDTFDWAAGTPGTTLDTVQRKYENFIQMGTNGTFATKGNIVLSHEINNMTMNFAVQHYPAIKKAYKHVTDVATCANITHPYLENTIVFPDFEASLTGKRGGVVPGASSDANQQQLNSALYLATLFGLFLVIV